MEFIIFWALIFGPLCGFIAYNRGRDAFGWGILGVLFGVFALIAVCAIPALEKKEEEKGA